MRQHERPSHFQAVRLLDFTLHIVIADLCVTCILSYFNVILLFDGIRHQSCCTWCRAPNSSAEWQGCADWQIVTVYINTIKDN